MMMMILINLIIIYIILNLILLFNKEFNTIIKNLHFMQLRLEFLNLKMILCISVLSSFFIGYIFLIKIANLFKESNTVDLRLLVVMLFFLFRVLRKFLVFSLKFSFFSLNYYCLLYFHGLGKGYYGYIYHLTHFPSVLFDFFINFTKLKKKERKSVKLWVYYFFKYIGYFILVICLLHDIFLNNCVLCFFFKFIPWYSLYFVWFNIFDFFNNKIIMINEACIYSAIYAEDVFFMELKKKHAKLPIEIQKKLPYEIYRELSHDDIEFPEINSEVKNSLDDYLKYLFQ